jgi:hypothetical protein
MVVIWRYQRVDLWEPTGVGDHRRISRRPEVIAALEWAILTDLSLAERLDDVHLDEQRWGGSGLHFSGMWRETNAPVLLKVGVGENELYWTRWLTAHAPDLVPTLFTSGNKIGPPPGLDLRWTVTERVLYGLAPSWQGKEFTMLLEAGVRFQRAAQDAPREHVRIVDRGLCEIGSSKVFGTTRRGQYASS